MATLAEENSIWQGWWKSYCCWHIIRFGKDYRGCGFGMWGGRGPWVATLVQSLKTLPRTGAPLLRNAVNILKMQKIFYLITNFDGILLKKSFGYLYNFIADTCRRILVCQFFPLCDKRLICYMLYRSYLAISCHNCSELFDIAPVSFCTSSLSTGRKIYLRQLSPISDVTRGSYEEFLQWAYLF